MFVELLVLANLDGLNKLQFGLEGFRAEELVLVEFVEEIHLFLKLGIVHLRLLVQNLVDLGEVGFRRYHTLEGMRVLL